MKRAARSRKGDSSQDAAAGSGPAPVAPTAGATAAPAAGPATDVDAASSLLAAVQDKHDELMALRSTAAEATAAAMRAALEGKLAGED